MEQAPPDLWVDGRLVGGDGPAPTEIEHDDQVEKTTGKGLASGDCRLILALVR